MPVSHPCTTQECQEAALAAMRAQKGEGMQSPTSPQAATGSGAGAGAPLAGKAVPVGGGPLTGTLGQPQLLPPLQSPATPLAHTRREGPGASPDTDNGSGNDSLSPPKAVRFSDTEADNLHVGLPSTSRTSSADSLHKTYDEAMGRAQTPPTASGFHVVHTAGGKLEAVSSSARWEDVVGYSRAVKRGPFIYVSGTSAVDQASGRVMFRRDPYKQTRLAFTIIDRALEKVGATMEDVVRTRLFVRNLHRDGEAISRAHGEVLGHVKPASTMVEVSRLVHEDILVLIEVDAVLDL